MDYGFTNKEQMIDRDFNDYVLDVTNPNLSDKDYVWLMDMWRKGKINDNVKIAILEGSCDISSIRKRYEGKEIKDYEAHHELSILAGVVA